MSSSCVNLTHHFIRFPSAKWTVITLLYNVKTRINANVKYVAHGLHCKTYWQLLQVAK